MVDDVRPISEDEYDRWDLVPFAAFGNIPEPERIAIWRARMPIERTLVAIDDGDFVGTTAVLNMEMRVPGGAMLPTAAVTAVAVLPTHRRRGVLTAMMRKQLNDVHERGEPLAALWASESLIYQRFGYGLAIPGEDWEIERVRASFARPPREESNGRVRLVQRQEALLRVPAIHERTVEAFHGILGHDRDRWRSIFGDGPWVELNQKELPFTAIFERDGVDEGFVTYHLDGFDRPPGPRALDVKELNAATPEAHEALWRYIFSVDLVDVIRVTRRAIDDPLPWMLLDPRRLKRSTRDLIWLRLVDVHAALGARSYSVPGRVTIEVVDEFCPWNDGRYVLEAGTDGTATCVRSDATPELTLSAETLAAAYLGATSLLVMRDAGRIEEHVEGATARAAAMFRTARAPWNPVDF
ncbi:MAG: GNAT family N-acetyltransferase [Chloroflexi bacterium]|nr:GNAT family N-acetyltransferase [Chloroflexota bacterium]MDA1145825.1 GNAT family N-acetyltransferase [Chloroflexota bacterium]